MTSARVWSDNQGVPAGPVHDPHAHLSTVVPALAATAMNESKLTRHNIDGLVAVGFPEQKPCLRPRGAVGPLGEELGTERKVMVSGSAAPSGT